MADDGGQQVLSPYHAMSCNPVTTVDPLGLKGLQVMSVGMQMMTPQEAAYWSGGNHTFDQFGEAISFGLLAHQLTSDAIQGQEQESGYASSTSDGSGGNEEHGSTGAWAVTNRWNEENIAEYEGYAKQWLDNARSSGETYTCEDAAFMCIIDYAASKGLPLQLTLRGVTVDAQNSNFNSVSDFKKFISERSIAADLYHYKNTVRLGDHAIHNPKGGDILLFKFDKSNPNRVSHTQVVYHGNGDYLTVNQGNTLRSFGSYVGTRIQVGTYDLNNDNYVRFYAPFSVSSDYLKKSFAGIYRWNFYNWNKK